jgi:hypothetical protein
VIGSERRAWAGANGASGEATGRRRRWSAGGAAACSIRVFQLPQLLQRPKN